MTAATRKETAMKLMASLAACIVLVAGPVNAADHQVKMLNKGEKGAMVFEPDFVEAAPGDTVTFVPTDKSHDAESIKGMLPAGAEPFKGKLSQEIKVTLPVEGVYGVKCSPHYGMGMVAMIVVGNPVNAEEAKTIRHPGKAKKTFADLFAQLGN